MTVSSQTNKVTAAGNGVTTVFSYGFQINTASDCSVIYTDALGAATTLSPSLYTLSGLGSPTGGTVTYPLVGSPIATGTTLTIIRSLALTQPTSITNQGSFYPAAVEAAIDRAVMEVQQVSEMAARAMVSPVSDTAPMLPLPTAAQRAGKGLLFDSSGNPIAGVTPATGVISAAMAPVVSAATLAAGRTALGMGAMAAEGIGKGLQDDGAGNARVNFVMEGKAVNYAVLSTDHGERYAVTGPVTFTLPYTLGLWSGFEFMVDVYVGTLTLTPNAADNIEDNATGASSFVPAGTKAYIGTDGIGKWYIRRTVNNKSAITPGGYLALTPGFPVWIGDQSGQTSLYYNQDVHGLVPIYSGTEWIEFPFDDLLCNLNAAQQTANNAHDCFIISVSGTPTLVIGPKWHQEGYNNGVGGMTSVSNTTPIVVTATGHGLVNGDVVTLCGIAGNTGANGIYSVTGVAGAAFTLVGSVGSGTYTAGTGTFCARGNGAGTTQLTRIGGLYVNANQITAYNGVTPYTVQANHGTYVGSIRIDSTSGQLSCYRSAGQGRKWGIWNMYNRRPIIMRISDPANFWSAGGAWGPSNTNVNNVALAFTGLQEEYIDCWFSEDLVAQSGSSLRTGIGYTSTGTPYGKQGIAGGNITSFYGNAVASYTAYPIGMGVQAVYPLESAAGTPMVYGGEARHLLKCSYRG